MRRYLSRLLFAIALPITLVLVWELIALWLKNPSLLPKVEDVLFRLLHPFSDVLGTGSLVSNILTSAFRVILGFSIAALLGVPLGLIMRPSVGGLQKNHKPQKPAPLPFPES